MTNFLKTTRRLVPGARSGIHVLMINGNLVTEENEISLHIANYWVNIIKDPALPVERLTKLNDWTREIGRGSLLPPGAPPGRPGGMEEALHICGRSAPGLDGIPYEACVNFPQAKDILLDMKGELMEGQGKETLPQGLNHSRMICLPKETRWL